MVGQRAVTAPWQSHKQVRSLPTAPNRLTQVPVTDAADHGLKGWSKTTNRLIHLKLYT